VLCLFARCPHCRCRWLVTCHYVRILLPSGSRAARHMLELSLDNRNRICSIMQGKQIMIWYANKMTNTPTTCKEMMNSLVASYKSMHCRLFSLHTMQMLLISTRHDPPSWYISEINSALLRKNMNYLCFLEVQSKELHKLISHGPDYMWSDMKDHTKFSNHIISNHIMYTLKNR
jgi:hypothetical protein